MFPKPIKFIRGLCRAFKWMPRVSSVLSNEPTQQPHARLCLNHAFKRTVVTEERSLRPAESLDTASVYSIRLEHVMYLTTCCSYSAKSVPTEMKCY
jgi:hypothetical protein